MSNQSKSAKEIIEALTKEYRENYELKSNREINQGLCVDFADDLAEKLLDKGIGKNNNVQVVSEDYLKFDEGYDFGYEEEDDKEILENLPSEGWNLKAIENVYHSKLPSGVTLETMNSFGETGYHVWVEFDGKFYDSECLDGVRNLFELPFYKRFFESKLGK